MHMTAALRYTVEKMPGRIRGPGSQTALMSES